MWQRQSRTYCLVKETNCSGLIVTPSLTVGLLPRLSSRHRHDLNSFARSRCSRTNALRTPQRSTGTFHCRVAPAQDCDVKCQMGTIVEDASWSVRRRGGAGEALQARFWRMEDTKRLSSMDLINLVLIFKFRVRIGHLVRDGLLAR
jgi:hypothetical protein